MTQQELESLLKLLRTQGVSSFEGLGIKVVLSTLVDTPQQPVPPPGPVNDDELLFWSAE